MNDLVRRDLFTCLGIWLALEIVCFGLLPAIGLTSTAIQTNQWFMISLPLGIGGAFLSASGTQLTLSENQSIHSRRVFDRSLAFLTSWVGLFGIGFPLIVMSVYLFGTLLSILMN